MKQYWSQSQKHQNFLDLQRLLIRWPKIPRLLMSQRIQKNLKTLLVLLLARCIDKNFQHLMINHILDKCFDSYYIGYHYSLISNLADHCIHYTKL